MLWLWLLGVLTCADPAFDPAARAATQLLDADAQRGQRWARAWGVGLGANVVGQFTVAAWVHDDGMRIDRLVAGSTSVLGVIAVIVTRPSAMAARRELGACPTRQAADAALSRVAAEERFAQAWYQHVLATAFNVGAGLYLGLAHDRWTSAAMQTGGGIVVSEIMLWTRPSRVAHFVVSPGVSGAASAQAYGLSLSRKF